MKNELAKIILDAMKIRSESYDQAAADAASRKADEERKADPGNIYAGMVDFVQFYRKTLEQACTEAATKAGEPEIGELVYYALFHAWNDCESWLQDVLGITKRPTDEMEGVTVAEEVVDVPDIAKLAAALKDITNAADGDNPYTSKDFQGAAFKEVMDLVAKYDAEAS